MQNLLFGEIIFVAVTEAGRSFHFLGFDMIVNLASKDWKWNTYFICLS
jgi:hypothetical protein